MAVALLCASHAVGQEDERYDFDGVADMDPQPDDPTDWMTSVNWSDGGFDPDERFGPLLPDFGTRVEIETSQFGVDAPEIGPGDEAQAFGVRIGRFGGEGLLTMTGGTLDIADSCTTFPFTCDRRLRVGSDDRGTDLSAPRSPGTFNLLDGVVTTDTLWIGSGSHGEMNMSGGEVHTRSNFYFDWTFDSGSVLNMSGGTIDVGGVLRMYRNTQLNLGGGEIIVSGAAELGSMTNGPAGIGAPAVNVSITDGLLASNSFLQIGGAIVLDGGILRAASFNEALSSGTLAVNQGGKLQFRTAQESVASVMGLITGGTITTSDPQGANALLVEVVSLDGIDYTQVSLAPAGPDGDFDFDGDVDGSDFLTWQRGFGGTLTAGDLATWESNFATFSSSTLSSPALAGVPEPATTMLAGVVCATMLSSLPFRTRRPV
jgi:hypothetical protein